MGLMAFSFWTEVKIENESMTPVAADSLTWKLKSVRLGIL